MMSSGRKLLLDDLVAAAAASFQRQFFESLAHRGACRIQLNHLAAFRVFERDNADVRKLLLARVFNVHRDQVVPAIRAPHRLAQFGARSDRVLRRLEIRDEKYNRPAMQQTICNVQCLHGVSADGPRHVMEDVPDHPQYMTAAFLGGQISLYLVCEEQQTHLVAVADGRESQDAGQFGGQIALAHRAGAEIS